MWAGTAHQHEGSPLKMAVSKAEHPVVKAMRSTLVGVVANVLLAATKGVAGILGHSYALIADAIESTMDIMSSLVAWGGLKIASVPPDQDHPYGHGKAEPLAAVVVAGALMVAALGIAIQSVREILTPQRAPAAFTLIVLVGVVIIKESLYRFLIRVGKDTQSSVVTTDAWHHRSDAITSIAAFIGISISLIGGEGYEAADDWAALFACCVIAYNGQRLLRPAIAEVMDTAPDPDTEDQVRSVAGAVKGVVALDACYVRKMGLDFFVDLHVGVDGSVTVREGHQIAHRVKDAIRRANPRIRDVLVHIEPADQFASPKRGF